MALSIMPSSDELTKLVTEITKDINMSLKQTGSIPDILSSGPWTINYLNQLRLLAYSPHVLRIELVPKEGKPFKHIEYNDLSPAIVQVVGHATNAFHKAHRNMNLVQMQARALFGNTGLAQDILMHLQSPDGGQSAVSALGGLKKGMERCSDYMGEVCGVFDEVIETAEELNLALTTEAAANQRKKDRLEANQVKQTSKIEVQQYFLKEHKKQLDKGEQRLKKAQWDFNKTSKNSELKMLGLKTLSDVQGFFSGTLGAAVNIVKESPNIALTGLKAVGNLGSIMAGGVGVLSGADRNSDFGGQAAKPYAAVPTIDTSLQSANEIESQLSQLRNIFEENLLGMLQSGETEHLRDCIAQMKEINARLSEGSYSQLATGILNDGIRLGEVVLDIQPKAYSIDPESQEWKEKLRRWQGKLEDIRDPLLRLRAAAATQVGQGFGNTTSSSPSDLNGITLQSLMEMRQNKLLMMETSMKSAQDNVQRITRQSQATQTKMIQLAHEMKQLDHSKAKMKNTEKVLLEAIDVLHETKHGFDKIKDAFDIFAGYIDIRINHSTLEQLTFATQAAQGRMSDGDMMCYQIQARTIVDMVLQLRGHLMFIYDMSKLYSEISQSYIMPCIDHTGTLKVSKLNTADQQEKEKAYIDEFTTQCSQEIIKIAQNEMGTFQKEMTARCEEIREDSRLQGLEKLVSQSHREAIQDAATQASDRMVKKEKSRIKKGLEKMIEKSSEAIINDACFGYFVSRVGVA